MLHVKLTLLLFAVGAKGPMWNEVLENHKSVQLLPQHIVAAEGEVTLFADYHAAKDNRLPVYLINRSQQTVTVPAQDRDVYLKLEARDDQGNWQRAQLHRDSECGLSYYSHELKPGEYMQINGLFPTKDDPAIPRRPVRYKFYSTLDVVSNAGTGRVPPMFFKLAAYDQMSIGRADVPKCKEVLFGKPGEAIPKLEGVQVTAIYRLGAMADPVAGETLIRVLQDSALRQYHDHADLMLRLFYSERLEAYLLAVLRDSKSPVRARAFRHPLPQIHNQELRAALLRAICNYNDPLLPSLIHSVGYTLGGQQDPEVQRLFSHLAQDAGLRSDVRQLVAHDLADYYADDVLDVGISLEANSRVYRRPLRATITLTNKTTERIQFDYAKPTEFIQIFVRIRSIDEYPARLYLTQKSNVRWLHPLTGLRPRNTVTIEPGQTASLQLNILDYFDLPSTEEGNVSLQIDVSCKIPGRDLAPQLSSNSVSIRSAAVR